MSTARLSSDDLYSEIQRLEPTELDRLVARVLAFKAERNAPHLSPRETELLQTINRGLPPAERDRYADLMAQRRAETLAPSSYNELLRLSDLAEQLQVDRVEALIELARLRGTTLGGLVEQMGLEPGPHA